MTTMKALAPPPNVPISTQAGAPTQDYYSWFLALYNRVGGAFGGFAPSDAQYVINIANGNLTHAQVLGSLSTGYAKVTTTTGLISTTSTIPNTDITGLGTLSTQSGTFSGGGTLATGGNTLTVAGTASITGTSSGTNTGDQTITLTSDVTGSGAGSFAATLATVNGDVGSFGDGTHVTALTVNGKGLITAASNVLITGAAPTGSAGGDLTGTYPNPTIGSTTGSGAFVKATSATLVTPLLGTPTSGNLANCSFPTLNQNTSGSSASCTGNAATVTTNANLTGPITSVGNATSIASQTGTGTKFVVDTSPTLVTPLIGTPTSGTLTNCTGLPTAGLTTITSGSAPAAGKIGEVISSYVTTSVGMTNNTSKTVASVTITAGSWSINSSLIATMTGTVTTMSFLTGGLSTTNNVLPSLGGYFSIAPVTTSIQTRDIGMNVPQLVQNVSGNTVIYLICNPVFATDTLGAYGSIIATRVA